MLENLPPAASSRSVLHSWHLFTCPLAIVEITRFCKKRKEKCFAAVARDFLWTVLFFSVCVCVCNRWRRYFTNVPFACSARWVQMRWNRSVRREWSSDSSTSFLTMTHTLFSSFNLLQTVCEWVSAWSACLSCYDAREMRQNGDGKKKCYRVYKVYINIHIYKYT